MKYLLILVFILSSWLELIGQSKNIDIDPSQYYQISIELDESELGSRIELSNSKDNVFLRLGNFSEALDINHPYISRSVEQPLLFLAEEGLNFQEQMRLTDAGHLEIQKLSGANTRNVVVNAQGRLQAREFSGYSDIYSITAHEFVSFGNPGEDHNYWLANGYIYHESIIQGQEALIAPVHLPHRATIRRIDVHFIDVNSDASKEVIFLFTGQPFTSVSAVSDTIGVTSGFTTSVQTVSNGNLSIQLDNNLYGYSIFAQNPDDPSDWPSDIGIRGVSIYYEL